MKEINLEFSYKGDRDYVHGTDIYKQIIKNLNTLGYNNWHYLELNIKKISRHNLTCFLTDNKQKLEGEVVNFVLKKDQDQLFGSIIENTSSLISTRYSFDESNITKHCHIDHEKESIIYKNPDNNFTTIDIVISMSKLFLENAVDNSVKWFFRTITFLRPIEVIESEQISMQKILQKRSIVGFDVFVGNKLIGHAFGASISK